MTLRVLADENVEHGIVHRLSHYGHDVEHVDFVPALGKGSDDAAIARYSRREQRLVLTNDDDFLTDFSTSEYHGLLFIADETLPSEMIADIVHAIDQQASTGHYTGVVYVSPNWL